MKQLCTICAMFFAILVACNPLFAQTSKSSVKLQPVLPRVFLLGEFEKQYEETMPTHVSLLEACDNNMEVAFDKLLSMMQEMEAHAKLTGFDLSGINAWMHIFWNANGGIEHIGFHLKPNSRNVPTEDMKNFLASFAKQYKFPLTASKKYSHYSSFAFPVKFSTPSSQTDKSTVRKGER